MTRLVAGAFDWRSGIRSDYAWMDAENDAFFFDKTRLESLHYETTSFCPRSLRECDVQTRCRSVRKKSAEASEEVPRIVMAQSVHDLG